MTTRFIALAVAGLALCSCRGTTEEPSPTQGPLRVVAAAPVAVLADTLAHEFAREYPKIVPSVSSATAREAIVALLNDSVSTVCIDRSLNSEERRVAAEAGIIIAETRIAWDALCVIVNAQHRVDSVGVDQIGEIVRGEVGRWSEVRGSGRSDAIEFVTTGRNSGLYESIQRWFVQGGGLLKPFAEGTSQDECVAYVARSPRAVALVSLAALRNRPSTIRVVPVEATNEAGVHLRPAALPSQWSVDRGEYPLRTQVVICNAERRLGPGSGLAAFAVSMIGQKLVQQSGLVPVEVPNRSIQLNAE